MGKKQGVSFRAKHKDVSTHNLYLQGINLGMKEDMPQCMIYLIRKWTPVHIVPVALETLQFDVINKKIND